MAHTPPVVGSSTWGGVLNTALQDIDDTATDSLAGGGGAVSTQQASGSTTYIDLATVGPSVSVTLTAARTVVVFFKAEMIQLTTTDDVFMSFAASGATTVTASDVRSVRHNGSGTAEAYASFALVACNAGTTTFTAKYKTQGGSGRWENREIAAIVS